MTEILAPLLATGDEDDYLVALDLCEQEGIAIDVPTTGIGPWGPSGSQSRWLNSRYQGDREWVEGSSSGPKGGGSSGMKSGGVCGGTRVSHVWFRVLGSRGPRWNSRWDDR